MSLYVDGELPVVATSGNCNNGGMFGNNGDWIWAFLLFALIGNNGWGGVGNRGGIGENYVLATDFANIERKLDGVNNGLCDGFYAQNTNMLNGFASVQSALCQGFNGLQQTAMQGFHGVDNAICTLGYQNQASFNALGTQLANCCCSIERGLDNVNTNIAKASCDIIRAGQDNTNAIIGWLTQEKISSLQAENSGLKAQISNDRQTRTIIDEIKPCPIPAYITCNPYQSAYGFGYGNSGCGCGCNG